MLDGKVNAALRLPSETENVGILPTNKQTFDLLKEKHPEDASKFDDPLLDTLDLYEEYAYEEILIF